MLLLLITALILSSLLFLKTFYYVYIILFLRFLIYSFLYLYYALYFYLLQLLLSIFLLNLFKLPFTSNSEFPYILNEWQLIFLLITLYFILLLHYDQMYELYIIDKVYSSYIYNLLIWIPE